MSKLDMRVEQGPFARVRTYTLTIPIDKMGDVNLTGMDRALLDDIEHGESSRTPVADILLGLETLVRRIEERTIVTCPNCKAEVYQVVADIYFGKHVTSSDFKGINGYSNPMPSSVIECPECHDNKLFADAIRGLVK